MARDFQEGVYVPFPCLFRPDGKIDYEQYYIHVQRVCRHGILPVVSGSMGEAVHIDREERVKLIQTAREALDEIGLFEVPIIAGTGANSTRESVQLAFDAAEAGADCVLVVPPGYYAGALDRTALKHYFVDIAKASPVPVFIYNFPGVAGGIDLDSELIEEIARESKNIRGAKLTCASVSKLERVSQYSKQMAATEPGYEFACLAGFIDFLLPATLVGGKGCIGGVPNFAPKTCAKLWELCQKASDGKEALSQANELQYLVSKADYRASKAGIAGMKALMHKLYGTGADPRRPLLSMPDNKAEEFINDPAIVALLDYEANL